MLTKENLLQARQRIAPYIWPTPIRSTPSLSALAGCDLSFKCEMFNKTGSFKVRGAFNSCIKQHKLGTKQVLTHSSGNHGQAVACAATAFGMKSYIVMPFNTIRIKVRAVSIQQGGSGDLPQKLEEGQVIQNPHGQIIFSGPNESSRIKYTEAIQKEQGAQQVRPYNCLNTIQGQSTLFQDIIGEVIPDVVVFPIGGGGMISGALLARKYMAPSVQIYGVEPELAGEAALSMKMGQLQPQFPPVSIADGLRAGIGDINFSILKQELTTDIITVSEEEIIRATKLILNELKVATEPSCATTLAAVLKRRELFAGKRVVCVLSGGNVDWDSFFLKTQGI